MSLGRGNINMTARRTRGGELNDAMDIFSRGRTRHPSSRLHRLAAGARWAGGGCRVSPRLECVDVRVNRWQQWVLRRLEAGLPVVAERPVYFDGCWRGSVVASGVTR